MIAQLDLSFHYSKNKTCSQDLNTRTPLIQANLWEVTITFHSSTLHPLVSTNSSSSHRRKIKMKHSNTGGGVWQACDYPAPVVCWVKSGKRSGHESSHSTP